VRLLHPFTPFITEDLNSALSEILGLPDETIMRSRWCVFKDKFIDADAEKQMERVKEAVRGIRAVRTDKQVPPSQKISVIILAENEETKILFENLKASVALLCGAASAEVCGPDSTPPAGAISVVISGATVYLPLDSLIDTEKERARLTKEKKKLTEEISRIESKLTNAGFVSKAPPALIAAEREKNENFSAMLAKVEGELAAL
jgi:valyl-tRNA synthetase